MSHKQIVTADLFIGNILRAIFQIPKWKSWSFATLIRKQLTVKDTRYRSRSLNSTLETKWSGHARTRHISLYRHDKCICLCICELFWACYGTQDNCGRSHKNRGSIWIVPVYCPICPMEVILSSPRWVNSLTHTAQQLKQRMHLLALAFCAWILYRTWGRMQVIFDQTLQHSICVHLMPRFFMQDMLLQSLGVHSRDLSLICYPLPRCRLM